MFVGPKGQPDKYRLLHNRSRGGEGEVWKAVLAEAGDDAEFLAIKIIHPVTGPEAEAWRKRWVRQADLLRSLDYPGVVSVVEVFEGAARHEEGAVDDATSCLCLVMEWVDGPTLSEWTSRNPDRSPFESLKVIAGMAQAIDYLHSFGVDGKPVVHRDIKPSNVIVTQPDDRPVLVDFGFAFAAEPGAVMSTTVQSPYYTAPEIAIKQKYTEASDRYSLGATAYYALTGSHPEWDDEEGMREKLAALPAFADTGVQDSLLAMMSSDPRERPESVIGWVESLSIRTLFPDRTRISHEQSYVEPEGSEEEQPRSRKRAVWVGIGVAAVLAVLGLVVVQALGRGSTAEAQPIVLPGVVGLDVDEAEAALRQLGATKVVRSEVATDDHAPGTVVGIDPAEGSSVDPGEPIVLSVTVALPSGDPATATTTTVAEVVAADTVPPEPGDTTSTTSSPEDTTTTSTADSTTTSRPPTTSGPRTTTTTRPRRTTTTTSPPVVAAPTTAPTTVPGRPGAPSASNGADGRSAVSWSKPSDGGAPIDSIDLKISTGQVKTFPGGTTTSYTWTGLTNGASYSFQVRAHNKNGWGPWSAASATVTPKPGSTVPGAMAPPTATDGRDGHSFVSWSAPSSDGGASIDSYDLQISTGAVRTFPGAGTYRYTWPGLTNGASYSFKVRAHNKNGWGPWSAASRTITPQPATTVPAQPGAPSASSGENAQSRVSWSAPSNGGAAIDRYELRVTSGGVKSFGGSTTSHTWTGLSNGTSYTFQVRAHNANGWSPWSGSSNTITPVAPTTTTTTTTKPPPPSPVASLSKGGSAQGQPGCTVSACRWMVVSGSNFSPNTTYNIQCRGDNSTFHTYQRTTNGSGTIGSHAVCYYGFPGRPANVIIGSVTSNTIIW